MPENNPTPHPWRHESQTVTIQNAEALIAALQGRLEAAEAALRDSEDARARLDAALRLVEWGSIDHRGDHFCSRCGGYIKEGHRSECEVGSALVERCDYCNHPVHFYRCEVFQCDCPSDDGGD